ncbi:DMT family transporter [Desulfovibrio inopinatus]|uniref:DMT family transporter n=1 Tax=Desulfovibrio inopinatus TaxID=102109 RepID=UPI00040577F7|nr:DMT family transporter [Desulfovibrio inopinatus]
MSEPLARRVFIHPLLEHVGKHRNVLPGVAVLVAVALWGASFAAMKVAITALNPMTVMWARMAIALLCLLPFLPKLAPWRIPRKDIKWVALLVVLQPCLYFLLESHALQYTTSAQAGVVSAILPLLAAFGAWLAFSERLTRIMILGLFVSLMGVAWLTFATQEERTATFPLLGNTLEFAAMVCAAGYMLVIKKLSFTMSSWALTSLQIIAGFIFFSPGAFDVQSLNTLRDPLFLAVVLFLGSCVTLGAFGCYNWAISHMPAARAASAINLIPVVAAGVGCFFLHEDLSLAVCIGGVCVVIGVFLSQYSLLKFES